MKNLKKVLALVMAFAMAFTMFAGAVSFDDVKAGDDYAAAITMLSDLEVISGNGKGQYEPNKGVTRAEACVLIANVLNGGKADTARFAKGSNFSDVAWGWWGESAIAYCVQNGITYGVGGGMFAPNRVISDAEFVAMLTRAMGYDTAANPLSFPYGNYTAAVNNGLLDNVPYAEKSECTKGEVAQMLYDALFADYARMTANLNVVHGADDHDTCTLIKDVFGLDRAASGDVEDGVLDCDQHYWVILGENTTKANTIVAARVDDKDQDIGSVEEFECAIDVDAFEGYKVVLWGETKHAGNDDSWEVETVKAIELVDGQAVYGNDVDTDDIDITEVAYAEMACEDDGDDLLHFMDEDANDKYTVETDDAEDWLDKTNSATFQFIDWDNDGECEFATYDYKAYAKVDYIDDEEIDLVSAYGVDETLDLDADEYVVVADGVEADDIVEITIDRAYDKSEKGEVLTITIEALDATTATYDKRGSDDTYYFDGEKVSFADEQKWVFVEGDELGTVKDAEYDLYFDVNGNVVALAEVDSDSDGYFMILDTENGEPKRTGNAQSRKVPASIDVLMPDGSKESFDVAYDLEVSFVNDEGEEIVKSGDEGQVVYNTETYEWDEDESVVGTVFEYTLEDGVVAELVVACNDIGDYEYDVLGKNHRIFFDGTDSQKSNTLKGDDFLFVVDADKFIADDEKAEKGIYVDTKYVMAITDLDQLPETIKDGSMTQPDGAKVKIDTAKRVVNGAVLGVDTLKYMQTNVKLALVTHAFERNGYYELYAAMDGKVEYVDSVKVDDFDELFESATAEQKFDAIVSADNRNIETSDNGLYCELYFDAEGDVIEIAPMTLMGDMIYMGDYYAVARAVVDTFDASEDYMTVLFGQVSTVDEDGVATLVPLYDAEDFVDDDLPIALGYFANLTLADDIDFYTIDQHVQGTKGEMVKVGDGFDTKLFEDIDTATAQKVSKIINDRNKDRYVVADVAIDITSLTGDVLNSKVSADVAATFTFAETVKEADGVPAIEITAIPVDEDGEKVKVAGETWIAEYTALTEGGDNWSDIYWNEYFKADADSFKIVDAEGVDVTKDFTVNFNGVNSSNADNKISFKTKDTVNAGTYTAIVSDGDVKDSISFTVDKKSVEIESAIYSKDVVAFYFESAEIADGFAKNPEMIKIMKGSEQIKGTAAKATSNGLGIQVAVDMANVTATAKVTIEVVDPVNHIVTNDPFVATYSEGSAYN